MKTKYKLIIIAFISLGGFFTVPFYATNIYCDIFESDNGGCMRIAGIGMMDYTDLPYFVIGHSTANPNECWYDDGEGNMLPCRIDTGGWPIVFSPWPDQNCDEICQQSTAEHAEMSGMSWISYGHQWILTILLMIVVLVTISVGIIFGVKIWRKRR